jgi:hypothetical protein
MPVVSLLHSFTGFSAIHSIDHAIAAFIDPFFSSGIHLALTSALSAAATICASIRGDCCEAEAAIWHTRRVSTSYTRYLLPPLAYTMVSIALSDSRSLF